MSGQSPVCACTACPLHPSAHLLLTPPSVPCLPITCPQRATVKLVPRLDLAAIAARKPEDARANFGKQPKVKPPAKPFNPDEVSRVGEGAGSGLGGCGCRPEGPTRAGLEQRRQLTHRACRRGSDAEEDGVRRMVGAAAEPLPRARPAACPQARAHRLDVAQQRDRATGDVYYLLNGSTRFLEGCVWEGCAWEGRGGAAYRLAPRASWRGALCAPTQCMAALCPAAAAAAAFF